MSVYEELSETEQFACRVIADHARTAAFSIADGIQPGNEGRNYVLRKIMRRAIYHGREHLGLKEAFFYKVCDFVVDQMREAFPELETQREFIRKMVRLEEERFSATLTVGLVKLNELDLSAGRTAAEVAFLEIARLYDTYGTPRDLIRVFLEEKGISCDEDEFNERFENALQTLQKQGGVGRSERASQVSPIYGELLDEAGESRFRGYDDVQVKDARITGIFDNEKRITSLNEGEHGSIVLDQTPFYAEAGGQVGDIGYLVKTSFGKRGADDGTMRKMGGVAAKAVVNDTYSPVTGLIVHKVTVLVGSFENGDEIVATVDADKRDATRRNHTATHLLHAALREVLGSHVKQAGSVVAPGYLRFDYNHYQPLSAEEIARIEDLVNGYILRNQPVTTDVMAIEKAMSGGAMALFGEKYGSDVRVLSIGDGVFSKELCGGTHVKATGDIGSFKVTGDEAIASGVRRIRAITGFDAFERFREDEGLIDRSISALKTRRDELPTAIERMVDELKKMRREIDELKLKIATGTAGVGSGANGDEAKEIGGVKVVGKIVDGLDANGARQLSDTLLARLRSGVIVLGRKDDTKASIIVRVSKDLTDRVKAGNVIKEIAPIVGGRGGGKPDIAEGGGNEPDKLTDAIDASYTVIEKMLGS